MSDARRRALAEFTNELQRLRSLAGSPSLNQLVELTSALERPLPRSTISDKLNAKSLPEWDFVVSFVSACQAFADKTEVPLHRDEVSLARWDALHLRMLRTIDEARGDERIVATAAAEIGRRAGRVPPESADHAIAPRQLPAAMRAFAGRTTELDALTALLDDRVETVVVSAIAGMAGIGKSTLAVHWAHQQAERFPDGQLFVNLRGFDPAGIPVPPAEALRGFLDAFGIAAHRLPSDVDSLAALYRSVLAGRRVLVVLDNARDSDQVRPLLPGTPGCVVVVTSRNRLTDLVASQGAHPLTVDVLTEAEARDLLARRVGEDRVRAEPAAVDAIVARCAGLPLALAVVAARAAQRPTFDLAHVAGELTRAGDELAAFDSVRALFSWSCLQLSPPAMAMFRGLGSHPVGTVTVASAASLAGTQPDLTRSLLAELVEAHLVDEHAPGRFGLHDLLRAYAAEQGRLVDPDIDRRARVRRLLDHLLHSAHLADRLLEPGRDPITVAAAAPGVVGEDLADQVAAVGWLSDRLPSLVSAVAYAAQEGFDVHAWQLAWTLTPFLDRQGMWTDWAETHLTAAAAAERLGDRHAEAYALRIVGRAYGRLGRLDDALDHFSRSRQAYVDIGDTKGEANCNEGMSWIFEMQGRLVDALEHSERALELLRAADARYVLAHLVNAVGWCHAALGDHTTALAYLDEALTLHEESGNRGGEAETHDTLGLTRARMGEHAEAADCYRRALAIWRELGYQYYEAQTLDRLGDALHAAGDSSAGTAREAWRSALLILEGMRDPTAGDLRAKLSADYGAQIA